MRIYAGHPILRKPFRGVRLEAQLLIDPDDDTDTDTDANIAKRTIVRQAVTDGSGEAIVHFPFPTEPGQTATLTVDGTLTGAAGLGQTEARATARVSKDFTASDRTTIRVETDKPLHKPGEIVHLRALVFNNAGHADANLALTLTIKDPDNKMLLEAPVTTNRFGIASYDWKTGPRLAPGNYNVSFDVGKSSNYDGSQSTIVRIQRYELPEFAVIATMDHGYYLEGQTPVVKIHAGYLFGKPVAAGSLRIARASDGEWDWRTGTYKEKDKPEETATLDANGDAEVHLNVKGDFDDLKQSDYERFTNIEYRAIVTDATTGRSEPRNFAVRISKDPVHIYLEPMGGDDHEGDYYLSTSYADGVPASAKVTLDWIDAQSHANRAASVTTNRYGLAKVHLRYPAHESKNDDLNLRAIALDAQGRKSKLDDTIDPERARPIWITVAHTLLEPEEPIEAMIHGAAGSNIDVDVLSENGLLAHQQVHMSHTAESLIVPISPGFHGLVTLRAYAMNSDQPQYSSYWDTSMGFKAVLYPQDRALKLKLSGLQPSYAPGATVDAGLAVKDAVGSLPPSAFGISVIDNAVELRAQTEEEANDRWFGFDWWQPREAVAGITRETLDQTDMSKPVPEDFDLAAEALLASSPVSGIQIDGADDNGDRNEYQEVMRSDLAGLGKAVLDARPAQLPADLGALRSIARNATFDDSILTDPWNTPYKAKTWIQWNSEVLTLVSAGPDKRFGTEDDLEIELTRRNLFELPGERMAKLIFDAEATGKSLPGTLDSLKALTRNGGLDLDSILDPHGKPYTYAIVVNRRNYSVLVSMQSGETAWGSQPIDYFAATEELMASAIQAWITAGKPFPDTEAEARAVFTKAGIDFDALRDPIGKPFQLRSSQVMKYTRVEKVKAGNTLEVKSTPVTHVLRALQVLRAPDKSTDGNAAGDAEVVAQFFHPVTEQSGSDLNPQAVDQGTFKGNTGAIGGTVTDITGAIIPRANVEVETSSGLKAAIAETSVNGTYLISNLAPGFYVLKVSAKGFMTWEMREVHVSSVSLTSVDVELNVGSETQSVTVVSGADAEVAVDSAEISSTLNNELVSASKGIVGPDGKVVVTGRNGKATISEPTFTPRLRHIFEETAYWAPSLETNSAGRVSLQFSLPDSLTTWKLHALASTIDGRVGALDQTFKTFQPFFVDLDTPPVLTVGDEITLPVNLRNYTDHALALPVIAKPADWFSLLTPARIDADVPANGTAPVIYGFRASKAVDAGPLRITASNAHEGDAVEKTIRVHPDGEPRDVTVSGLLRYGPTTLALDLPLDSIPGSVHAELMLYPNLRTHLMHAMKAVLERPYGCGEQTISSTYPSLLFLELLKATGAASSAQTEAQTYLQLGYDRLLGYFDPSGGLTYWGGNDHNPDPALT
ncbi:MAG: alpha-2-macroglobulin family protein, partial [Terracidiphilus sp.]